MSGSNASNANQQPPSPADLARELIRRLDEYEAERFAVMNNCREDDVALEQLRDSLVRVVARHGRTIAEVLLAAEEDNADLRGNIFPQVRIIAKELVEVKTINEELRAKLAAAEARVAELERANSAWQDEMMEYRQAAGRSSRVLVENNSDMAKRLTESLARVAELEADNATLAQAFADRVGELGTRLAAGGAWRVAAEARVNALEAACEKALAVIPNLLARSWPSNSPMKQDAEDALRAVLAKGKGATA